MNFRKITYTTLFSIIILFSIAFVLLPLFIMFITAIQPGHNYVGFSISLNEISLAAFSNVFKTTMLVQWFLNSLEIGVIKTSLQLLLALFAGFALAYFDFYGKKIVYLVVLAVMILPVQSLIMPQYLVTDLFGWIDSFTGVIVPQIASAFMIFMLRQAFLKVPYALVEAARIEGCNPMQLLYKIYVPISKSSLLAMAIIGIATNWNDYNWSLLILKDKFKYTLPIATSYFQDGLNIQIPELMAVAALTTLPLLIIYIFTQKYFIEGFANSGIK